MGSPMFKGEGAASEPCRDLMRCPLHSHPWMMYWVPDVHPRVVGGRGEAEAFDPYLSSTDISPSKSFRLISQQVETFASKWNPTIGPYFFFFLNFDKVSLMMPKVSLGLP